MRKGYISGLSSFYVFIKHVDGMTTNVDDNIMSTWNYEHYKFLNEEFEHFLGNTQL
jgi:hypothetical protein